MPLESHQAEEHAVEAAKLLRARDTNGKSSSQPASKRLDPQFDRLARDWEVAARQKRDALFDGAQVLLERHHLHLTCLSILCHSLAKNYVEARDRQAEFGSQRREQVHAQDANQR